MRLAQEEGRFFVHILDDIRNPSYSLFKVLRRFYLFLCPLAWTLSTAIAVVGACASHCAQQHPWPFYRDLKHPGV